MTKQKNVVWFGGPPPSIGWWPASWRRNEKTIRWWDGRQWSTATGEHCGPEGWKKYKEPAKTPGPIRWRHRPIDWPAASYT